MEIVVNLDPDVEEAAVWLSGRYSRSNTFPFRLPRLVRHGQSPSGGARRRLAFTTRSWCPGSASEDHWN